MEVILLEKMGKIGDVGEKITVKAGYARNYLFPYSKAVPATKENVAEFEARRAELVKAAEDKLAAERKRAEGIQGVTVSIEANTSDEGKLFGSVGPREIADAARAAGTEIDKSEVEMPEGPIQHIGEYPITITLSPEVSTEITVLVTSSNSATAAIASEPAEDE